MASIDSLVVACHSSMAILDEENPARLALWDKWLQPISVVNPVGDDPGYDDDFQQLREEVNKIFGADTGLILRLAEKLLMTTAKDIRTATYYAWARLHRDGEAGLSEGLELVAALLQRFGDTLHPQRDRSRKGALEWLGSSRMQDSLSLYPEANHTDVLRIAGALRSIELTVSRFDETGRPQLGGLYSVLETRLLKSGGIEAVVPQNVSDSRPVATSSGTPMLSGIASGQDLLAQARLLAKYLNDQPEGWLAAHHLMKSIRHDTLHQLPPLSSEGKTRLEPPKPDQRALLKRLYLQQSWQELLEQADSLISRSANHLWLDLQWYIHQALLKSGREAEASIIQNDLNGLLSRLIGLEGLAFNDGTPFADEVTLNWIQQQVMDSPTNWQEDVATRITSHSADDDVLQLEPEALRIADTEGAEAALAWLQHRPGVTTLRQQWLLRLLMARLAEQTGKNELALHLLGCLDNHGQTLTLAQWEPTFLFEVKARRLKLLRMKAGRNEGNQSRLTPEMEQLLAGLIAIDPARAAVLCT